MISCFVVRGHSMAPSLRSGDFVVVLPLRGEPRSGDVIVYRERTGGFLVVHRVGYVRHAAVGLTPVDRLSPETDSVSKTESVWYFTKGDANPTVDPHPVSREQVLGRICWSSRQLGRLITLLRRGRS